MMSVYLKILLVIITVTNTYVIFLHTWVCMYNVKTTTQCKHLGTLQKRGGCFDQCVGHLSCIT